MVGGTPSLGGGFPGGAMSAHADVLGATPSTSSDRLSLVEELKRRGRISVSSRNFPEADRLYGKAIEVMNSDDELRRTHAKDLAVLHANRSMAVFHQHNLDGSLADARVTMDLDPSYVKGYWRAGQALAGLDRCEEAVEVYERALGLDATNKAISKEVAKLRKRIEDEKRLMEKAGEEAETGASAAVAEPSSGKPIPPSRPPAKQKTATAATKASTAPKSSKDDTGTAKGDVDDDVTFTDSDAVRGYKIVGGKKTSYFHHEMTEEERRLIGDIAPKKLDGGASAVADMDVDAEEKKGGTSAWNKAGTWEERDVTAWAKETLTASLLSARFELPVEPRSTVTVTEVRDMSGHASVATVRGKRRFIFEFAFKLHWQVPLSNDRKATGTMTFPDVDGTCDGEYDMSEYTVGSDSPPEARHLLDRFVRNGGLRDEVTKALNEWVQLFEATYAL